MLSSSLPFIRSTFSVISGNSSSSRFSPFLLFLSFLHQLPRRHFTPQPSMFSNRSRPDPPIMARGIFLSPLRNYRPRTAREYFISLRNDRSHRPWYLSLRFAARAGSAIRSRPSLVFLSINWRPDATPSRCHLCGFARFPEPRTRGGDNVPRFDVF